MYDVVLFLDSVLGGLNHGCIIELVEVEFDRLEQLVDALVKLLSLLKRQIAQRAACRVSVYSSS